MSFFLTSAFKLSSNSLITWLLITYLVVLWALLSDEINHRIVGVPLSEMKKLSRALVSKNRILIIIYVLCYFLRGVIFSTNALFFYCCYLRFVCLS